METDGADGVDAVTFADVLVPDGDAGVSSVSGVYGTFGGLAPIVGASGSGADAPGVAAADDAASACFAEAGDGRPSTKATVHRTSHAACA